MPRFFLHIYNSTGFVEDEEGQELPDLGAARATALAGIRSVLAAEVAEGSLDLRGRIEIAGEAGEVVAEVKFREALQLYLDQDPS